MSTICVVMHPVAFEMKFCLVIFWSYRRKTKIFRWLLVICFSNFGLLSNGHGIWPYNGKTKKSVVSWSYANANFHFQILVYCPKDIEFGHTLVISLDQSGNLNVAAQIFLQDSGNLNEANRIYSWDLGTDKVP